MPTTEKLRNKLMAKLTELFQLDQPDLDFGFYRIMQAKAGQVKSFIDKDLLQIIEDAFGQVDENRKDELGAEVEKAIEQAKKYGAPDPEATDGVKEARAKYNALKDGATAESDVYDHLYRFFERYYDEGDFISRRYYARENAGKAAPFAIPYNGEEVKLHWANADQYYIKTAEYFSNYSFDITQAAEIRKMSDGEKVLNGIPEKTLKVHFRIVDASEGEHGNVKAAEDKKRFFILHEENPVEFNETQELVINFEYKALPGGKITVDSDTEKALKEKFGKSLRKGDMPNLAIAEKIIKVASGSEKAKEYLSALGLHAPTDKIPKRPLLAKYINQYTARNTCDYFIHKDLSGFLKRELDFYIKNEVMHLDDFIPEMWDLEKEDFEVYSRTNASLLRKISTLRKIATKLIDFLAQLEDFQKKLWLKKKFITETNYCITLDRVPEELYGEIAENDAQREEWIKLFAIDEIKGDAGGLPGIGSPAYSVPLTTDFLKTNDKLVLDTAFFSSDFKERLIALIEDFDEQCDGLLIHSENFQALNLLQERYREQVKCIHIDPPYNTDTSGFLYKNEYQHSSWLTLMKDRIAESIPLLNNDGLHQCHIDENEYEKLQQILDATTLHSSGTLIWDKKNPMLGRKGLSTQHEYVLFNSVKDVSIFRKNTNIRSMLAKARELIKVNNGDLSVVQKEFIKWINSNPDLSGGEKAYKFIDEEGMVYRLASLSAGTPSTDPRYFIPQLHPETNEECPVPPTGWSRPPETFERLKKEGRIVFGKDHTTLPQIKLFLTEDSKRQFSSVYSLASRGKNDVQALGYEFPYCHPVIFYEELIGCSLTYRKDTILDYYGGSGTAGHATLNLIKESGINFNYILAEMGDHFDNVLKPRITKVIYSSDWKNGKPTSRDTGISQCFKYIRLESYEDTLNNLVFDENPVRGKAIESNPSLKEDYMLRYLLDVETRGSQSLLNIDAFADPTAYSLVVKKPGSDEQVTQNIDLIETFNYLLGLRLENKAAPQTFTASFTRKPDPELPEDQHTKLVVDGKIKQVNHGFTQINTDKEQEKNNQCSSVSICGSKKEKHWWFRKLEGWVPADPMNPNNSQKERVLTVWRKLTGNLEEDNLMLDEWFEKYRISTRDFEYDTIYVNGSNNLPNLRKDDENWKVRLIEEEFHKKMWEVG